MTRSGEKHARVCVLTDSFYPVVGGGENHAKFLLEKLAAIGTHGIVVTRRRIKDHKKEESLEEGIRVFRVCPSGFNRLGKYLMMVPAFIKLVCLRREFDCVYVCGLRTLGIVAVLFGRFFRKKVILRSESCGEMSAPDFQKAKLVFPLPQLLYLVIKTRNFFLKKADRFVAISSVIVREYAENNIPADRITQIYNGIDTELYAPVSFRQKQDLRRQLRLPAEATIFVYTGKLNRGKGLELLIRVFDGVQNQYPGAFLLLVGAGDLQFLSCEKKLKEYVKEKQLERRVLFTGYTRDVHRYLQASDVFILASESEAHPLSLVEAMSCGLLPIATVAGGIPDVIEDGKNGLLIPIGAEAGLRTKMENILKDKSQATWASIISQARTSVVDRFGIKAIAKKHQELFDSML